MNADVWRSSIELDLVALADLDYQERCFSGRSTTADTSPGEMISTIYDDDLLVDFVHECLEDELRSVGIGLVEAIDALADSVDLASSDWQSIINSDKWRRVVKAAARLLDEMRGRS